MKIKPIAAAALAAGMIAGCGPSRPELHVYTWTDYIAPEVLQKFEQKFGCTVVVDTFDSNESMYAKLKAGATGYDVITPSSYQISLMAKEGMIDRLDHARLPNVKKNFDKRFATQILDPSFAYSVPYAVTYTGLCYLKNKIPAGVDVNSWSILGADALKGRISLALRNRNDTYYEKELPQVNLNMVYSRDRHLPLYLRMIFGSVSDVATIVTTARIIGELGLRRYSFSLDRGFFSEENLWYFHDNGIAFTIGVPLDANKRTTAVRLLDGCRERLHAFSSVISFDGTTLNHTTAPYVLRRRNAVTGRKETFKATAHILITPHPKPVSPIKTSQGTIVFPRLMPKSRFTIITASSRLRMILRRRRRRRRRTKSRRREI